MRAGIASRGLLSPLLWATLELGSARARLLESAAALDTDLQPSSILLAPESQTLVIASFGSDSLQTFRRKDGCGLAGPTSFPAGRGPLSLAFDAARSLVYATYFSEDAIAVLQMSPRGELEELGRIPARRGPSHVAVSPDGNTVFVASAFDGVVSLYQRSSSFLSWKRDLETVPSPGKMAVHPAGRFLYVADERNPILEIFSLDPAGSLGTYEIGGVVEDLAFHPSRPVLYASEGALDRISTYRIDSDGRISPSGTTAVELHPQSIAIDASGELLFALCRKTHDIHVYDVTAGAVPRRLDSFPSFELPEALVVAPDSKCLYVVASAYGKIHALKVTR